MENHLVDTISLNLNYKKNQTFNFRHLTFDQDAVLFDADINQSYIKLQEVLTNKFFNVILSIKDMGWLVNDLIFRIPNNWDTSKLTLITVSDGVMNGAIMTNTDWEYKISYDV